METTTVRNPKIIEWQRWEEMHGEFSLRNFRTDEYYAFARKLHNTTGTWLVRFRQANGSYKTLRIDPTCTPDEILEFVVVRLQGEGYIWS